MAESVPPTAVTSMPATAATTTAATTTAARTATASTAIAAAVASPRRDRLQAIEVRLLAFIELGATFDGQGRADRHAVRLDLRGRRLGRVGGDRRSHLRALFSQNG